MNKPKMISFGLLISMFAVSGAIYGQGRGRPPQVPSQSQGRGRYPGFPTNAGLGQPTTLPEPNENANGAANAGLQPDVQSTSAVDQLARAPKLADRLEQMMSPLTENTTLSDLADGFSNLGLFVAAVQVSNNVEGVTFDGLKTNILDGDGMSLGEAIQAETDLNLDQANQVANEAEEQAEELIDENS